MVPGVKEDGTPNDIPVSAQSYYSTIGLYKSQRGYAEAFVHDASYIKLKELSVGYEFPQSVLRRTPLTSLRMSFVARNLCFLMKHTPGNPEADMTRQCSHRLSTIWLCLTPARSDSP